MVKTNVQMKMPDLSKIADAETRAAIQQLVQFLYDNQNMVYDDLVDLDNRVTTLEGP
jgi:hypothetical protein